MVRAKFMCVEKGEAGWNANDITAKVVLQPVTGGSDENKEFFKYTPSGRIEMGVMNTQSADQFEVGKFYYVDFSPAD